MRILNLNRMQLQRVINVVEDMMETDVDDIVSLILDLVNAD